MALGLAWLGLAWLGLAWLGLAWRIVMRRAFRYKTLSAEWAAGSGAGALGCTVVSTVMCSKLLSFAAPTAPGKLAGRLDESRPRNHSGQPGQAVLEVDDGIQTLTEKIGVTTIVLF